MMRNRLVVAAALLISLTVSANAAEMPEHKIRNAQKLIATLDKVGINNKELRDFITDTDSHIDKNGFMSLRESNVMGGKLSLYCDTKGLPTTRKFELRYAPTDAPHVNVIAHTNMVEVRYHLEF